VKVLNPGFEPQDTGKIQTDYNENDKLHLLTVSRLDERKGHKIVIDAIKDLDVKYTIIGSGEHEDEIKNKIKQAEVEDKVNMEGFVEEENLADYYQNADLFVMPSEYIEETGNFEGFGIVYLEAQSYGLPVIASNEGGASDAMKDGKTGFLISPTSEQVKEKIKFLLENPGNLQEMSETAVKFTLGFKWNKIISEWDREVENLVV
jgi:phosphatidylinositol alpha-1,6-mannosyltransferase